MPRNFLCLLKLTVYYERCSRQPVYLDAEDVRAACRARAREEAASRLSGPFLISLFRQIELQPDYYKSRLQIPLENVIGYSAEEIPSSEPPTNSYN